MEPEGFEPSSNLKSRGERIRTSDLAPPRVKFTVLKGFIQYIINYWNTTTYNC